MTSLSTSGWRAGLILSRLSESKTDSASHVVPSNSSRHEGGTPESTEERKLTLLKVSFLSVSSSGVPPEVTTPPPLLVSSVLEFPGSVEWARWRVTT